MRVTRISVYNLTDDFDPLTPINHEAFTNWDLIEKHIFDVVEDNWEFAEAHAVEVWVPVDRPNA